MTGRGGLPPSLNAELRDLLADVAKTYVLPRWRNLAEGEVTDKGGGDPVTLADLEAEQALHTELCKLVPGAAFIGEEAVAADPSVLRALSGDGYVWVVDPVDGTKNFTEGSERFCVMAALLHRGVTIGGWIHLPIEGRSYWAAKGEGAFADDERLPLPPPQPLAEARGSVHLKFLPAGIRAAVAPRVPLIQSNTEYYCAGLTYVDLARDRLDLAFFWRSKPWDHLAGCLLLEEAGGRCAFLGGENYSARAGGVYGLLASANETAWADYAGGLFGGVAALIPAE